ncbi:MAG: Arabinose metabolism transcriptional repressor [Lentisphaerae bacterium ADurb.Bin242]|nr:MAG: Arabinose metabolism transcriptional repressor [Lentisphaerae bacterium ADurb.Bin242]
MVVTKYAQIQNKIIEYIARKNIRKDGVLPTEKKMAELFGVSSITIRKAISNLEAEKIVRREQGRGTFLQMDLTDMKPRGELLYLDIIRDTTFARTPIFFPWIRDVEKHLKPYGWKFSTLVTSGKPDAAVLKRMRGVKGIIASNYLTAEWVSTLRSLNIPIVIMGAIGVPPEGIPVLTFDYEKMTKMLAEKLLEQGAKKFALFPGGRSYIPAQQMFRSLSAFLAKRGIAFSEESVCFSDEQNRAPGTMIRQTGDFLAAHPEIDAFLVESEAFIPMMVRLYESPRRPLIGILSTQPRFLNFAHNVYEAVFEENIAEKSLDVLLNRINGGKVPKHMKIAPKFSLDL